MQLFTKKAVLFSVLGLCIYTALYAGSEVLLYRTGKANPLYKVETLSKHDVDWVILGASHAMTLSFDDAEQAMERDTGLEIINLSAPGTGPLYQKFVFERFLERHTTRGVIYAADSFALLSRTWNEDRFSDSKMIARSPFSLRTLTMLLEYVWFEDVPPLAILDYATGFSKINNPARFQLDAWEGETQFDRRMRPSPAADAKRVTYLYPASNETVADRYLGHLRDIARRAHGAGASVIILKLPLPPAFKSVLPNEADYDRSLSTAATAEGAEFLDLSALISDPQHYFDTDHLNRSGVTQLFNSRLRSIMTSGNQ
jgi:hypothetical protein